MKIMKIGKISIGEGCKPLVIPEIGINHGGSLAVAKEMVFSAYKAGAQIIKHQTHIVDDEMSSIAKNVIPGNSKDSIYDIMSRCALSEDDERELKDYTESLGMIYLSTPFSRAAADRLERMGVLAYKIGSGELNNFPLLEYVASFGKPMIISTGMNGMQSISKAVSILENKHVDYALLHTTNLYPTLPSQVRFGAMQALMEKYQDIPVGLSDHTTNNNACIGAMALGAKIVERHYTDVMSRMGPDIICSMDMEELSKLLQAAEEISQMIGGKKEAIPEEQITIDFAYATVVTIRPVKNGEEFTKENIWVKRPGKGGILAEAYNSILGRKAMRDIDNDTQLTWEMISFKA